MQGRWRPKGKSTRQIDGRPNGLNYKKNKKKKQTPNPPRHNTSSTRKKLKPPVQKKKNDRPPPTPKFQGRLKRSRHGRRPAGCVEKKGDPLRQEKKKSRCVFGADEKGKQTGRTKKGIKLRGGQRLGCCRTNQRANETRNTPREHRRRT